MADRGIPYRLFLRPAGFELRVDDIPQRPLCTTVYDQYLHNPADHLEAAMRFRLFSLVNVPHDLVAADDDLRVHTTKLRYSLIHFPTLPQQEAGYEQASLYIPESA